MDLVASGIDLSVRLGKLRDSSLAARRLGFNPWVIVAAPGYLAQQGMPKRIRHFGASGAGLTRPCRRTTCARQR